MFAVPLPFLCATRIILQDEREEVLQAQESEVARGGAPRAQGLETQAHRGRGGKVFFLFFVVKKKEHRI